MSNRCCLLRFCLAAIALGFMAPPATLPRVSAAEDARSTTSAEVAISAADADFFEKQIRPLFVAHCQSCHGAKKQEYGLRLDLRDAALAGSDAGPVIVPGKPDESSLIEAVRYAGSIEMPPAGKLKESEIAALTEWVRRGAPWPKSNDAVAVPSIAEAAKSHWAFQPVVRPSVPNVKQAGWARTPIDRFILAKLESAGMSPSPEADKRTLLRRLSFDLLGLPPTPEELDAFLADERPDAYERLVDRLLASPQYGERWARYWLDIARFADTKGYVFFESPKYPWAWTYRDYVIRAFNEDLPYDQFLREQLAADLISEGKPESLAAMGFLTCGNHYMGNQHDILDDRIDVVARGVLGLTIGCARCHDHKFDPIPAADYYSLYGIFRSSQEPLVPPLLTPEPATAEYRAFHAELQKRLAKFDAFVVQKFNELADGGRTRAAEYLAKAHSLRNQPSTENFMLITDKGELNPVMIVRWQKYLEETKKSHHPVWAPWHAFAELEDEPAANTGGAAALNATFAQRAAGIVAQLERPDGLGHPVNRLVRSEFAGKPVPQSMEEVVARYAALLARIDREWLAIPAVAEVPGDENAPLDTRLPDDAAEELRLVFYGPEAPPNIPQMLGWGFLSLLPDRASQNEFKELIGAVETWSATGGGAPPRAMALVDTEPYEPRVFLRGNPNRHGEAVPRWAPAIVDSRRQPFESGSGRLELANVLTRRDNPLTARVMANRVWMHHFGTAIVTTPGDFGLRSDPPSHPELLDWLAAALRGGEGESGRGGDENAVEHARAWSLKHLHRQIVLSAVYRQQSSPASAAATQPSSLDAQPSPDPENRLLGRMNRRRLDFEALRDNLVAVSGSLDSTIGGPSVDILGAFSPRRTLYGQIDRQDLATLYRDYDFPDPAASSPQRETTTVPPQALFLMNNAFASQAAARLLNRTDVRAAATLEEKLDRIARIVFARSTSDAELALAREFLGATPDAAAWERYVHALLLTNEFAFVD